MREKEDNKLIACANIKRGRGVTNHVASVEQFKRPQLRDTTDAQHNTTKCATNTHVWNPHQLTLATFEPT